MDRYQIIGEVHDQNTVMLLPAIARMAKYLLEPGSAYWTMPDESDADRETFARKVASVVEDLTEKYEQTQVMHPELYDDFAKEARRLEESASRTIAWTEIEESEKVRMLRDAVKKCCAKAAVVKRCQEEIKAAIMLAMPPLEVLYLEGTKEGCIDDVRDFYSGIVEKVVHLDEGVPAYSEILESKDACNKDIMHKKRERAWVRKMVKKGPGLAVFGAGHIPGVKKGLEKLGKEVEIIFDAASYEDELISAKA